MLQDNEDDGLPCGRADKRDSLFLLAVLCDEDGDEIGPARIRNLSATGMMADCTAPFIAGMRIKCAIRGVGNVSGEVVRVAGGRIAVRFDTEIDPLHARRPVTGKTSDLSRRQSLLDPS